jgi:hypothetical protein
MQPTPEETMTKDEKELQEALEDATAILTTLPSKMAYWSAYAIIGVIVILLIKFFVSGFSYGLLYFGLVVIAAYVLFITLAARWQNDVVKDLTPPTPLPQPPPQQFIFTYARTIVVYHLVDSPHEPPDEPLATRTQQAEQHFRRIFDTHPAADLKLYEEQIGVKIIRIDRANSTTSDDAPLPVGKTYPLNPPER